MTENKFCIEGSNLYVRNYNYTSDSDSSGL
jgi:hypothetical protein